MNEEHRKENDRISMQYLQINAILITGLLIMFVFTSNLANWYGVILGSIIFIAILICCISSLKTQDIVFGKLTNMYDEVESKKYRDDVIKYNKYTYKLLMIVGFFSMLGIIVTTLWPELDISIKNILPI